MIDVRLFRTDPDLVRQSLSRRGAEVDLDALIDLEASHRELLGEVEQARAEQNRANKQIAQAGGEDRAHAIAEAKRLADRTKDAEAQLQELKSQLDQAMAGVPNLVHPDAPDTGGEDGGRVLRSSGEAPSFDFAPKDHLELGEALGIIDVQRAAKVSGSRFGILRGDAAMLELALVRFALDQLAADGFIPVIPPVLVRREAMFGTGFFPTDEVQVYKTSEDDLYLVGTSEVPLAAMHSGEIFEPDELPIHYAGYSPCFRREAGTYGKDTRGIIRVHQFDKVEMFAYTDAGSSGEEHDRLVAREEAIMKSLGLPYRVVDIPADDLGAPAYRKIDLEVWLPGAERWLEVTSCSNCTDFQARRLDIRVRGVSGNELVHTLNGTAVAVQRTIVALLENHQQADGSVVIPEALRPYTGFEVLKP